MSAIIDNFKSSLAERPIIAHFTSNKAAAAEAASNEKDETVEPAEQLANDVQQQMCNRASDFRLPPAGGSFE
eukprot:3638322-Alexandrium_andersonii.AAC.1